MVRNLVSQYYPADDNEKELMKQSPAWKKIEDYIADEFELEAILFTDSYELEQMKIRAFATYQYEITRSVTSGEQGVQGMEYAWAEMKGICNSFFYGILKNKN
ncbi:hypothetical protein DF185_09215 [Marinifilum breve]|uniref:Uncharacterized protein n=1 Tax=Marinifilum breve TaxID=2184082 RepID=A0A2V3ZYZ3_9BACT|nr:hypothetical protein [Marinifilum breve]PXY01638.1 hypothetical protein DF185_09215 [Marinifilum breve]